MPRVVKSIILDAPVEAVWDVIRDFNGHDHWHPAVAESHIERGRPSDMVGCVRNFRLGRCVQDIAQPDRRIAETQSKGQ